MSLVDELRESIEKGHCSVAKMLFNEQDICNIFCSCEECIKASLLEVADRIEKEYIERPTFYDGEPVKIGDVIETRNGSDSEVFTYKVTNYGKTTFFDENKRVYVIYAGERVKRAEQEHTSGKNQR